MKFKRSLFAFAATCAITAATPLDLGTDNPEKAPPKSPHNSREELKKMCDTFDDTSRRQYEKYRRNTQQTYEHFIKYELLQDEMHDMCERRVKREIYAKNNEAHILHIG